MANHLGKGWLVDGVNEMVAHFRDEDNDSYVGDNSYTFLTKIRLYKKSVRTFTKFQAKLPT